MSYNLTDVVEALVREYLVRTGCNGALEAFNREKPKHAGSITKREVLRKILGLDNAASYYKKQNPAAEGIPSTLEVWVNYQMAKIGSRMEAQPGPHQASRLTSRHSEEPDESSAPVAALASSARRPSSVTRTAAGPAAATPAPASPGAVRCLSVRRKGAEGLRKKSKSKRGFGQLAASVAATTAARGKDSTGAVHARRSARPSARPSFLPRAAPPRATAAAAAVSAAAAARRPAAPSLPPLHAHKSQPHPPPAAQGPPAKDQRQQHSHPHHPTAAAAAGSVMTSILGVHAAGSGPPPGIPVAHKPMVPGPAAAASSAGIPAVAATPVIAAPSTHSSAIVAAVHVSTTPAMPPVSNRSPTPPKSLTALPAPVQTAPVGYRTPTPLTYPTTALSKVPASTTASVPTTTHAPAAAAPAAASPGLASVPTMAATATGPTIGPTATSASTTTHGTAASVPTASASRAQAGADWLMTTPPAEGLAGRPVPARQGFGFGDGPSTAASSTSTRAPAPAVPPASRRASGPSRVDDDEPEIIHAPLPSRGSVGTGGRPGAGSGAAGIPHSASASNFVVRAAAPGFAPGPVASAPMNRTSSATVVGPGATSTPHRTAAAVPRPSSGPGSALRPPGSGGSAARYGGDLVMEDVGDMSFEEEDLGMGSMRISGPTTREPGAPISPDTMRQLRQLLWGGQGQPPPSWKQGFFFNRRPGLQFGLLQKQGGPCGVLAALQAHILAALHSPSTGFNLSPRPNDQLSALTAALSESLWQARMGPAAVVVLPEGEAGGAAGRLGYDQLSRAVASHSATTKEALADLIRGALSVLMSEDGWGVVLFVMSLALSRGVSNIQGDMDEPNNSLMGMHGYCTQELVNLILLGAAISNVFDGNKQLDGSTTLKGISRRCRLGMLTLFEWYKYVEVGPSLKNPTLPVWVICSESHFTVLFAQDSRALQNQLPFDLLYYDELANQETIIKLSVSRDPKGGWTAKAGSTIGDRGKCEGQNIPPLECVIETRWPGVKVNWNGHDPIL